MVSPTAEAAFIEALVAGLCREGALELCSDVAGRAAEAVLKKEILPAVLRGPAC
jgi:hypothetical protein